MPPMPNMPNTVGNELARTRQAHLRSVDAYLDEQNAANAKLRDALADPRESPPPAVTPAPDGGVVGRVDDLQLYLSRRMRGPVLIATLRIARWDRSGRPLPSMAAEMRGGCLKGEIIPGDWVQLPKNYDPSQPLRELTNLMRGEQVEMKHKRVKNLGDIAPLNLRYL